MDDQTHFCHLAREILSKSRQFAVLGETYCAQQAMALVGEFKPDVILMDMEMESINVLEATHLIIDRFPEVRVVLMSFYNDKEYSRLARRVGALAFVAKKDFSAPVLAEILNQQYAISPDPAEVPRGRLCGTSAGCFSHRRGVIPLGIPHTCCNNDHIVLATPGSGERR